MAGAGREHAAPGPPSGGPPSRGSLGWRGAGRRPHRRARRDYLAARGTPRPRRPSPPTTRPAAVAALLALGRARGPGESHRAASPTRPAPIDGWESPHTVVEVVSDDAPFLVDSVSTALVRHGYDLHLVFRPLLDVDDVGPTSHLHLEIDRETDRDVLDALRDEVESVVDDVFAAVADWDALRGAVTDFAGALRASPPDGVTAEETAEVATYLDWLADDHFTFVGAVAIDAAGGAVPGSELGVARRRPLFDLDDVDPVAHRVADPHPGSGALDRAPRRPARLRHGAASARRRHRRRRAPPARSLHRQRVQRQRRAHPGGAPQGRRGARAVGLRARRPRRARAGARARHLPARRDVPSRDRRARRADDGDRGHGVATPGAPVREPRPGRVLRVVPRVPAARPLHHAGAQVGRRCAVRRVRRCVRRLHRARHRGADGAPRTW